jgi:hypothetical protein
MGKKGRKNWRVRGISRLSMRRVATKVFANGPGLSITQSEKIPRMARKMYCASQTLHWCFFRLLRVSAGFREVSRLVIEAVVGWFDRSLVLVERNLRRRRCGMMVGREMPPGSFGVEKKRWVESSPPPREKYVVAMVW